MASEVLFSDARVVGLILWKLPACEMCRSLRSRRMEKEYYIKIYTDDIIYKIYLNLIYI